MKVATLWQFWASAMALELKKNETRGRQTHYRGLLAIHAAKTFPASARDAWWNNRIAREAIQAHGYRTIDDLPRGVILCVVNVVDCISTNAVMGSEEWRQLPIPGDMEWSFGDYAPNRWAWITENCQRLIKPVPYSGNQTIHALPLPVLEQVRAQLPPS